MLRRTKSVVECTVPPKEELTVFIPMTEAQRFWTLGLLTRLDVDELEKIFRSESKGRGKDKDAERYLAQMKQTAKQGCESFSLIHPFDESCLPLRPGHSI